MTAWKVHVFSRVLFALVLVVGVSFAEDGMTSPERILAKSKEASGGAKWDQIALIHTTGNLSGSVQAMIESWVDPCKLRFVARAHIGPATLAQGFTGDTAWSQDDAGQVSLKQTAEQIEEEWSNAYRGAYGYYFPQRWPAQLTFGGRQQEKQRSFLVVRIAPVGHHPFDLWIDGDTFLVDRVVDGGYIERYSDYHEVNGIKLPFRTDSNSEGATATELKTVDFSSAPDDRLFQIPADSKPDFEIRNGRDSAAVPFQFRTKNICLDVRLNGKGPFRMILDSGAANIITPELASALGLKPEGALSAVGASGSSQFGMVKVSTVDLGEFRMRDQVFGVLSLAPEIRGRRADFDGIIGYEVFKRVVVRIDYDREILEFFKPGKFSYAGSGSAVPIRFSGTVPFVSGELDGIPGEFTIDTGNSYTLDLVRPFWERNRLDEKYKARFSTVTSRSIGGLCYGKPVRTGRFRVGSVDIPGLVAVLSEQRTGSYSQDNASGNIGEEFLSLFNLVFDYSRQRIIFERNSRPNNLLEYDRSGMAVEEAEDGFEVLSVVPGGPAASVGIADGDRILAVDGAAAAKMPVWDLRAKLRQAAGVPVQLRLQGKQGDRKVTLILRDLL